MMPLRSVFCFLPVPILRQRDGGGMMRAWMPLPPAASAGPHHHQGGGILPERVVLAAVGAADETVCGRKRLVGVGLLTGALHRAHGLFNPLFYGVRGVVHLTGVAQQGVIVSPPGMNGRDEFEYRCPFVLL
ncbi:hypothetical protein [Methanogenium cariaci]|uniref:hypothetical protein n=1 Tax=Methanogenium cariaci TaxID=2197 RepID=UPI00078651D0|nr:hypothetical protein [Methanogenium cariaci]